MKKENMPLEIILSVLSEFLFCWKEIKEKEEKHNVQRYNSKIRTWLLLFVLVRAMSFSEERELLLTKDRIDKIRRVEIFFIQDCLSS